MNSKWVFILLFSLALSPEPYFLLIWWFSRLVNCYGKFSLLISFSLHVTKTSLKSSIQRRFDSYSKKKNPEDDAKSSEDCEKPPSPYPWNASQMRCCSFVPDFLSQKKATVTWVQLLFLAQSTGEERYTSASHLNSPDYELSTFIQEHTWGLICQLCSWRLSL